MRPLAIMTLFAAILSTTACDGKDGPIVPEPPRQEQPEDKPTQQPESMTITIAAGDLMLYSGSCIVLFYGPAGGYSYTRIGKLTSTDGLKEALGTGGVKVSFASE